MTNNAKLLAWVKEIEELCQPDRVEWCDGSDAEYDRMIQRGVFDARAQRRLEFIRGEILEMTPIGTPHQEVVARLVSWSAPILVAGEARLWVQSSPGFPELESAPQPDVAWVAERNYWSSRPTAADVLLVIEVAETSLQYDRGEKADLYAEAGVPEYWIVNLVDDELEVHREPARGEYRRRTTHRRGSRVSPQAWPDLEIEVDELLPPPVEPGLKRR